MAKDKKSKKKAGNKYKKKKVSKKPTAAEVQVGLLNKRFTALSKQLKGVLPLHLRALNSGPATGMRRIRLAADDTSPDILNAWVEDELVLHAGKRVGLSRPRPIGETITLTVEADGMPNQPVLITLAGTDPAKYVDTVPNSGHYEGGDVYKVV